MGREGEEGSEARRDGKPCAVLHGDGTDAAGGPAGGSAWLCGLLQMGRARKLCLRVVEGWGEGGE